MRKYSVKPTGIAIVLILLAIAFFLSATNIQAGWLYALDSILWSFLIFGFFSSFISLGKLRVTRSHSAYIYESENLNVSLSLFNTSAQAVDFMEITDTSPIKVIPVDNLSIKNNSKIFLEIKPKETVTFEYTISSLNRGIYRFNNFILTSHDYFGLFLFRKKISFPSVLKVYPVIPPLQEIPETLVHKTNTNKYRRAISGDITSNLREYVAGDSTRLIHWKSTARYNKLMVKEPEQEESKKVILLINLGYSGDDLEKVIKKAGSLSQYCFNNGNPLKIVFPEIDIDQEFLPKTTVKNYHNSWEIEINNWLAVLEWLTIMVTNNAADYEDIISTIDKSESIVLKVEL